MRERGRVREIEKEIVRDRVRESMKESMREKECMCLREREGEFLTEFPNINSLVPGET